MAISLDAASKGSSGGSSTLTIAHTVAGTDRYLLVLASCVNSGDYLTGGTAAWNGTSMTQLDSSSASSKHVAAWGLVAPETGTHDFVLTFTSGAVGVAYVVSWEGVDQTSPVYDTFVFNDAASSPKSNAIGTESGAVAVDLFLQRTSGLTLTPDGSQTRILTTTDTGFSVDSCSYRADTSAMAWSFQNAPDYVAHIIVALAAASGGGGSASTSILSPKTPRILLPRLMSH